LEQVWNFSITPSSLLKRIMKNEKIHVWDTRLQEWKKEKELVDVINSDSENHKLDIVVGGEEKLSYIFGHCCRRKIPKEIIAHINNKWVITIHKRDCQTLHQVNKERLLPAYVKGDEDENLFFHISLKFKNRIGILKELSEIIYSMWIDIDEIRTKKLSNKDVELFLSLVILDYDYLIIDRFVDRIKLAFSDYLHECKVHEVSKE
jgi:(p)ppGpp synthase/HD superfamily hydrolase